MPPIARILDALRSLTRWGAVHTALFLFFLPLSSVLFNLHFGLLPQHALRFWVLIFLLFLLNIACLYAALRASASSNQAYLGRLALTATSALAVVLPFTLANGPVTTFLRSADALVGVGFFTHLLIANMWIALWLPIDYANRPSSESPSMIEAELAHRQYLQLLWPSVFLYGAVWVITWFSLLTAGFNPPPAIVTTPSGLLLVTNLAAGYIGAFLRILGHLASLRQLLAQRDSID